MFENRLGKRSHGNNDHTYYHVEAKGHLDIFEKPEELRFRLDVLKESEERLEESKKKLQMLEDLKKQQGILSLLDFFNTVKQQDDDNKLEQFIPVDAMDKISVEKVDN